LKQDLLVRHLLLLTALLASPIVALAASPNLVVNGSFEDNAVASGTYHLFRAGTLNGWTTSGNGLELRNNLVGKAQAGLNFAEVDRTSFSQVLNTVEGTTYDLSFYYSNRPHTAASTNGLSFDIGSGAIAVPRLPDNNSDNNIWKLYTTSFVATSSSTTLSFGPLGNLGDSGLGTSLDNISVTADMTAPIVAVPEPETYALMLAGLASVGVVGRRRRANKA
jgi:hypothetical protein